MIFLYFLLDNLCNFLCGCLSIEDISPPRGVRAAMEMQAEAERKKRAQILESEGDYHPEITISAHVMSVKFLISMFIGINDL